MVQKCNPKYKNLNYIQSFSEQGYATLQLMQQACMNDEWLRQKVLTLGYLTPPATRRRLSDYNTWVNNNYSYGHQIDSDGNIVFSSPKTFTIPIDFVDDDNKIDWEKTDAIVVAYDTSEKTVTLTTHEEDATIDYTDDGDIITEYNADDDESVKTTTTDTSEIAPAVVHRCQLPYEDELAKKTYVTKPATDEVKAKYEYMGTRTSESTGFNSAWYVGFDKSKNYYVRPDWLKQPNGWKDIDIPAVCRGQTFKATKTGKLESIDLVLDYTGKHNSDCGSPLYVQIWGTTKKSVQKTKWNTTTRQVERVWKKNYNGQYKRDTKVRYKELEKDEPKHKGVKYYKKETTNGTVKYTEVNAGDKEGRYYQAPPHYIKLPKDYKRKSDEVYYSKVMEKVAFPDTKTYGIRKPMAQGIYDPDSTSSNRPNIVFDKQCKITKGNSYFVAVFSPLSEWKHCPRWAGWGRNCGKDNKYAYGHAFLSTDNGRHWKRFGRNDYSVDYKLGKYTPQDYIFRLRLITNTPKLAEDGVTEVDDTQYDDDERYLYLKPILTNPITNFSMTATDHGSQKSDSENEIVYEYSTRGIDGTWNTISEITPISFDPPYPRTLFFRAKLKTNDTTFKSTPYIENLSLTLTTTAPKEMYVRTNMFIPPPSGDQMLGANIWGRVFAPYTLDVNTECSVELITNNVKPVTFTIIDINQVVEYMDKIRPTSEDTSNQTTYNLLDTTNILTADEHDLCDYLNTNPDILDVLKEKGIYVKPYIDGDNMYKLSFTPYDESTGEREEMLVANDGTNEKLGGLDFNNDVAYPILECQMQPFGSTDNVRYYGEWFDFTFDYDTNILTFDKYILESMPTGTLQVKYNELFIDGLSNNEVGVHVDNETGLRQDGLLLDYFKENFIITQEQVRTRRIQLKVNPLDPIREVVLNRDTDNEVELYEDWHYKLDPSTNELIFQMDEDISASILKEGDKLEVVYTPNLTATGLSIGFFAKRTNTDMQVHIKNGYLEYKS